MPQPLTNAERRKLKSEAQLLKAMLKVGRAGLSAPFLQMVDETFKHHELIKVRFDVFKEQKHELAALLAEKTGSELVWIVGHVAVFFRRKPQPPGDAATASGVTAAGS